MDADTAFTCASGTIEYLVHFVTGGYSLSDDLRYLFDLKPEILQPASSSQSDRNGVVDGVCGEYPAVRRASTDACAAPKRSEKPKLAGRLDRTKQADCSSHTKRPARSTRKKSKSQKDIHGFS